MPFSPAVPGHQVYDAVEKVLDNRPGRRAGARFARSLVIARLWVGVERCESFGVRGDSGVTLIPSQARKRSPCSYPLAAPNHRKYVNCICIRLSPLGPCVRVCARSILRFPTIVSLPCSPCTIFLAHESRTTIPQESCLAAVSFVMLCGRWRNSLKKMKLLQDAKRSSASVLNELCQPDVFGEELYRFCSSCYLGCCLGSQKVVSQCLSVLVLQTGVLHVFCCHTCHHLSPLNS